MKIINIHACEILNAQGLPAIECSIELEDKTIINSCVSSGTFKGKYEAFELLDGGSRFSGKGVLKATEVINNIIAPEFLGKEPNAIDMDIKMLQMDGTTDKSNFGANSILAVSMAMYRAHAMILNMELFDFIAMASGLETVSLPIPMINFISGNSQADNNLFIQEYLVIPYGAKNVKSSLEQSVKLFYSLKENLLKNKKTTLKSKEGSFAPKFENAQEPLDYIIEAIKSSKLDNDIFSLGIDSAASQYYDENEESYNVKNKKISSQELIEFYKLFADEYNLFSLEDPLDQDDWQGWIELYNVLGEKTHIIGDDLFATNPNRISKGIELGAANTVLIKPNQIGTITETLQSIALCKENGLSTIVAHSANETNDTFIVDLAVGSNSSYIKCGGLTGGENICKYNRLIEIERQLLELTGS